MGEGKKKRKRKIVTKNRKKKDDSMIKRMHTGKQLPSTRKARAFRSARHRGLLPPPKKKEKEKEKEHASIRQRNAVIAAANTSCVLRCASFHSLSSTFHIPLVSGFHSTMQVVLPCLPDKVGPFPEQVRLRGKVALP